MPYGISSRATYGRSIMPGVIGSTVLPHEYAAKSAPGSSSTRVVCGPRVERAGRARSSTPGRSRAARGSCRTSFRRRATGRFTATSRTTTPTTAAPSQPVTAARAATGTSRSPRGRASPRARAPRAARRARCSATRDRRSTTLANALKNEPSGVGSAYGDGPTAMTMPTSKQHDEEEAVAPPQHPRREQAERPRAQ